MRAGLFSFRLKLHSVVFTDLSLPPCLDLGLASLDREVCHFLTGTCCRSLIRNNWQTTMPSLRKATWVKCFPSQVHLSCGGWACVADLLRMGTGDSDRGCTCGADH